MYTVCRNEKEFFFPHGKKSGNVSEKRLIPQQKLQSQHDEAPCIKAFYF